VRLSGFNKVLLRGAALQAQIEQSMPFCADCTVICGFVLLVLCPCAFCVVCAPAKTRTDSVYLAVAPFTGLVPLAEFKAASAGGGSVFPCVVFDVALIPR
jgi:hypothetical protein